MTRASIRTQGGYSIVEVLVAVTVMITGVLTAASLIDRANAATGNTRAREAAHSLARELAEGARSLPYERLVASTFMSDLADLPGLEDTPSGGSYQVERRGVRYTITGTACGFDDERDGVGEHADASSYCAGSPVAAPGMGTDRTPEDYRRLSFRIAWTDRRGRSQEVRTAAIANNPGAAGGPAVRSVTLVSPLTTTSTSITFEIVTSFPPQDVQWFLDGTPQPTSATRFDATGTVWRVTWDISAVVDGPYVVGAEAIDAVGLTGAAGAYTVVLNRSAPAAPKQVAGGFDPFGAVELEWAGNSERDIVGYEVRRADTGTVVCPRAMATSCVDQTPPAGASASYVVYAYDQAPDGTIRAGAPSSTLTVSRTNAPPLAPVEVRKVRNADGSITLQWPRSAGDPDPGDGVDYYRVYRDGQTRDARYARWYSSDATVTWTDRSTGGDDHRYWVTAVDRNFAESPMVEAVAG